ncbi:hypothetical protein [Streptomyces sp. NBC_01262]|uniref:hypothetical protein n=1 Tax=Streptomyces sp. NBC_01262 TaxID=2903803 RepID=UPI002E3407CD|nr:hypothetical protein [Streptomyces sp. NBC_01262]
MREELADFDFGLTGLTERFHQDWRTGLTGTLSARDVVAESADYDARAILEDTLRVLHSSLPTWAVTALWHASTERNHDLDAVGTDGRAWLREIVDVCVERIKQDDPDFTAAVPVPAPDALTGAVLDEILIAGPALTDKTMNWPQCEVSGVVPALESAVHQVGPDLGFRLFLRAMLRYRVPISRTQFERYVALGERFGFAEFFFTNVEVLTGR